jgi:hypothetical protein
MNLEADMMEARTTFHGSPGPRNMVVAVTALLGAMVLVVMGGLLFKTLSAPAAAPAIHVVAAQPGASGVGSAWNYSSRRSGTQTVEGPAPTAFSTSASFREPASRRGGPQS